MSVPFRIGISEAVNTVLAIWMAEAAGFYDAAGLKVEVVNMNGGSRGAAELAAGRIDAMHVGLSSVVRLNQKGSDLRVIAALANVIRFTFFSAPGVHSAADLKGRVVGITSFGSESDTTATLLLRRLGLRRDDVVIKEYGGGRRRLDAVMAGEIAATPLNEPVASQARDKGVHVLLDLVPERVPWLFTALVVRRAAIAGRREALAQFVKATAEGNMLALADAARARAVLGGRANINDSKILEISYKDFRQLSPPTLMPTDDAAKTVLAQFAGISQSVEDYVDRSLLDELKRDGVLAAMQRNYGIL